MGQGGHVALLGDSLFPARARAVAQATIVWPLPAPRAAGMWVPAAGPDVVSAGSLQGPHCPCEEPHWLQSRQPSTGR